MISGEELGVKMYLHYDDERYPLLIMRSKTFDTVGYSLDLSNGVLKRVCICNSRDDSECVCNIGVDNERTN